MNLRILSLLNVAIVCASVAHSKQMDVADVARRATPAVVLLEVKNANGLVISTGTGFFISANGTLLTNRHVLEGAVTMDAKLPSGEVLRVSGVLGSGDLADVAAL